MIKRELPANIYRCKGFVYLADDPTNRYVLQVVGRRVDLVPQRPWGAEQTLNRVVAIAHDSAHEPDQLSKLFGTCVEDAAVSANR